MNSNGVNFNPVVSFPNAQVNASLPANYLSGNTPITYTEAYAVVKYKNSYGGTVV